MVALQVKPNSHLQKKKKKIDFSNIILIMCYMKRNKYIFIYTGSKKKKKMSKKGN